MADDAGVSAYDEWLARREAHRRLCAAGGDDRLSALPDDVLRLIVSRLDTRSALATAALSKHWTRFSRELPVLEFKVSDVLPERYRRYLRRRAAPTSNRAREKLGALMGRHERQGMRSLASSVKSFLDADSDDGGGNINGRRRRSARAMTLELFATHSFGPFDRLVAKAVGDWGVQELEVVVLAPATPRRDDESYTFPHHCFGGFKSTIGGTDLKKLKLINCAPLPARSLRPRPLPAFSSLTMLVLQGMPSTSGGDVYERVIRACPALEVLHLKCCLFYGDVSVHAPGSHVAELVVDGCTFAGIDLRALPRLERLALMGNPMQVSFGALPRLGRLNLSFYDDPNAVLDPLFFPGIRDEHSALQPSSAAVASFPDLDCLVVRFTGIVPEMGTRMPWGNVRRLLVADMPRSWDIFSWTCRVLEAAPFLETLHVHFADEGYIADRAGMTGDPAAIPSPPSGFKIRALREVVIVGFNFNGAGSLHARFVRFLIRNACNGTLEKVALLKRGRVCEKGLWDWQMGPGPEDRSHWSDDERDALFREIQIHQQDGSTSLSMGIVLG